MIFFSIFEPQASSLVENIHNYNSCSRMFIALLNHMNLGVRYMFDMAEKEAEELKDVRKEDIIEWYRTYLRQPSPKCRRLAIHVWGCNTDWKDTSSTQVIKDLVGFKNSSEFYPSLC